MSSRLSVKNGQEKQRALLLSPLILAAITSFLSLMLTWYATSGIVMLGSRLLEALCFILILIGWYRSSLRESRPARDSISPVRLVDNIVSGTDKRRDDLWSLLDKIPGMIIVLRADGTTEYVNQRLMEHYNHAKLGDYDNLGWKRMVHPDDLNILATQWQAAVIARASFACECRTKHFDGTWHWVRIQFEPFLHPAGESSRWFGAVIDIDQRRRSEDALKKSEYRLRMTIETMPALIWRATPDGHLDYVNERVRQYTGKSVEDFALTGWVDLVHPDDFESLMATYKECFATGKSYRVTWRMKGADGGFRWFRALAEPLRDDDGTILHWHGMHIDIHEQRLAEDALRAREQHLRLVTETIPALVWVSTPDGSPIYFNRRAIEYTGSTVDSLGEGGCQQFVHPEDTSCTWDVWEDSVSSGKPYDVTRRLRGADGTFRWFHARAEPFRDQDGNIVCWYGFDIDVDDRLKAEECSRIAQANLLRATQLAAAGELSASIAHEINQPLTAAVANGCAGLQFLKEPVNLERARRAIGSAVSDVKSAAEVVQKVRGLFKQATPERNKLDIAQHLAECMRAVQDELRAKSIHLTMRLGAEPQEVYADRIQIQQVINNIVRNAIDVMDLVIGRPRELQISVESQTGEPVRVEFRDNGPGITDLEKIFEPFFTSKEKGLGVGLSICRSIVDAHGGRLTARVAAGWTIFELSLPPAQVERCSDHGYECLGSSGLSEIRSAPPSSPG
jgi:PAS domain S-box-containing protein